MYRLQDGIKFMKGLPSKSVDGIFTDPPWGGRTKIVGNDIYLKLIKKMTRQAARVLKPKGVCIIWMGTISMGRVIKEIKALEYKWCFYCRYIPPRFVCRFMSEMDPILVYMKKGAKYPRTPQWISSVYFKPSTGKKDTDHPCARPRIVVKRILNDFFKPGDYVIDPFAGSDTTGVSCRQLNIKSDTCEIDPAMYKTGLLRNEQGYLFENKKEVEHDPQRKV